MPGSETAFYPETVRSWAPHSSACPTGCPIARAVGPWSLSATRSAGRLATLHDGRGYSIELGDAELGQNAVEYRGQIEPQVGFGRLAVLVDVPAAVAGAQRMIELLELGDAIVTQSEADAKEWLGLPRDFRLPYRS